MNNYRRPFFSGRNGADELSVTLVILGVVLFLAAPIFDERIIQGIFILLGGVSEFFGIFRSLSKNVGKRRSENIAFVNFFRSESDAEKEQKKREKPDERKKRRPMPSLSVRSVEKNLESLEGRAKSESNVLTAESSS